jgi:hypothetical protein
MFLGASPALCTFSSASRERPSTSRRWGPIFIENPLSVVPDQLLIIGKVMTSSEKEGIRGRAQGSVLRKW